MNHAHLRLVRLVPDPEPLRVEELVRPAVEAPPKATVPGMLWVLVSLVLGGVGALLALAVIAVIGG